MLRKKNQDIPSDIKTAMTGKKHVPDQNSNEFMLKKELKIKNTAKKVKKRNV